MNIIINFENCVRRGCDRAIQIIRQTVQIFYYNTTGVNVQEHKKQGKRDRETKKSEKKPSREKPG